MAAANNNSGQVVGANESLEVKISSGELDDVITRLSKSTASQFRAGGPLMRRAEDD